MISWIPFLGRNGIFNQMLMRRASHSQPLEFLLFSDFAVIVAYVHLFTLFMVVPIFNSMARIDTRLIEAAKDAGASRCAILREIVLPLSKVGYRARLDLRGHAGDGRLLRGEGDERRAERLGGVGAVRTRSRHLQYPPAAASAVLLVIVVMLMVAGILRVVDVRKELAT